MAEEKKKTKKPDQEKKKYNKDGLIPGEQVSEKDYQKIINKQRQKSHE